MMPLAHLLAIIQQADFEAIEAARDQVSQQDLPELITAYPTIESWVQKAALINLVQDHLDPRLHALMRDFLQAPNQYHDDVIELTKAIALCHLEGDLGSFMRYYHDRRLLAERVYDYTRNEARAQEPAVQSTPAPVPRPKTVAQRVLDGLLTGGVFLALIGAACLLIIWINQNTLNEFRTHGATTRARVTDKGASNGEQCLGVSFFDRGILDGGELYLTEICDFIPTASWEMLHVDSRVTVVFLPEDPQDQVILAASLDNPNLTAARQYPLGSIPFLLGLCILVIRQVSAWWLKQKPGAGNSSSWLP